LRRAGFAWAAAAGVLAVACAGVGHADAATEARVAATTPPGVLETMTVVLPASRGLPGGGASGILRATFVAPGVYADPQVADVQAHAGELDAADRERLGREALRAFHAVSKWRTSPPPGAVPPEPGSRIEVRVQFLAHARAADRD
jgi:hypothetical protein